MSLEMSRDENWELAWAAAESAVGSGASKWSSSVNNLSLALRHFSALMSLGTDLPCLIMGAVLPLRQLQSDQRPTDLSGIPIPIDWIAWVEFQRGPASDAAILDSLEDDAFGTLTAHFMAAPARLLPRQHVIRSMKLRLATFLAGVFDHSDSEGPNKAALQRGGPPPTTHQPPSPGSGLSFEVHTRLSGKTVYYSPAYFLNPNLVFGHPSTPVRGSLPPGRYVFGIDRTFAPDEYDIPPSTSATVDM